LALPDIFASTLGLSAPWQIINVSFAPNEKRIDITVAFMPQGSVSCPHCGSTNSLCKAVEETWFHEDFFSYATYLHTKIPLIHCCDHASVDRPWSRPGSKFALLN
jgi:transposase